MKDIKIMFVAEIRKLDFIESAIYFSSVHYSKIFLFSSWVPSDFSFGSQESGL
jgi:hypothetical protein